MKKYCLFCDTDMESRIDVVCSKCHEQEVNTQVADLTNQNDGLQEVVFELKETIRKRNLLIKQLRKEIKLMPCCVCGKKVKEYTIAYDAKNRLKLDGMCEDCSIETQAKIQGYKQD